MLNLGTSIFSILNGAAMVWLIYNTWYAVSLLPIPIYLLIKLNSFLDDFKFSDSKEPASRGDAGIAIIVLILIALELILFVGLLFIDQFRNASLPLIISLIMTLAVWWFFPSSNKRDS